ncbi:(5-formylfuran-3-yl)methyl phosphate synthase [Methylococcus sp. EFPC2]|uniref:(5-formylfuran-3-yl)methyl phosphate synthase n=1 Tax=Methylococcus sp. EFPC2 TaxID=2812648 RepID=UPI001967907F|nr:(5-formylfuran-3-yl)methyl phosphate synthase [Methylococcus sp. EFPC2]QSA96110.1 (5-formylfuran-3-yl)methyl phosphate synthase [Methylococcus sp. EFPC2]
MSGLLASVKNLAEARLVLEAGADIVDLKNPAQGALGALPLDEVRAIVRELGGQRPLSATVGDLPMQPETVEQAVRDMAATGVDYVKIGFFPGGDWSGVIQALTPQARQGKRLIAVLFGDDRPELRWVGELAKAGFTGTMLDTRDKTGGSLTRRCPPDYLEEFAATARELGLLCGLAGSLRRADIEVLLPLQPDYLGFRGALCRRHDRTDALDPAALEELRVLIAHAEVPL